MGKFIDRIMDRITDRPAPEETEEEQDIEALRERKLEILKSAGLDTSYATDDILDAFDIIKRPFHLR